MPPEEPFDPDETAFIVRTDAGARKIVARIDELTHKTVKYDRLIAILGSAAMAIIAFTWKVTSTTVSDAIERGDRIHAEQMRELRTEIAELRKAEIYAKGTYEVVAEKRPAAAVAKEVREVIRLDGGTR